VARKDEVTYKNVDIFQHHDKDTVHKNGWPFISKVLALPQATHTSRRFTGNSEFAH
jgi:hypothetical protein